MDELIEYFARLRLDAANLLVSPIGAVDRLIHIDRQFVALYNAWLQTPMNEKQKSTNAYIDAQGDFVFVAQMLIDLIQSNAIRPPVTMPGTVPSQLQQNQQPALTFGDQTGLQANTKEAFSENVQNQAMVIAALSASDEVENSTIATVNQNKTGASAALGESGTQKQFSTNKTEASQSQEHDKTDSASPIEMDTDEEKSGPMLKYELTTLSFRQQSGLFEQLVQLKPIEKIDEKVIDIIIQAIHATTKTADELKIKINQAVVRTAVMMIAATFDTSTAICWDMYLGEHEPTFEMVVAFLIKRKAAKDVQETSKIFKIPKKIESRTGRAVEQNMRTKHKSTPRSATPSPARNPYKRPKANAESICFKCRGNHLLRDCPIFKEMSPEDREAMVARRNLCINCFSNTHKVGMCLDKVCKICKQKHNSLLHHRPSKN